jgi:hypothetical protein
MEKPSDQRIAFLQRRSLHPSMRWNLSLKTNETSGGEMIMNDDPNSEKEKEATKQLPEDKPGQCACFRDPFAAIPPEFRPRQRSWMDGLRKVTCPGCGLQYWTNRDSDDCSDCQKKNPQKPVPAVNQVNPSEKVS